MQIRTVLQHAWAEFEHDIRYKRSGEAPDPQIDRAFTLAAGLIELADQQFSAIRDRHRDELTSPADGDDALAHGSGSHAQRVDRAWREARREDLVWAGKYLVPWVGRRIRRRSSGDNITAKRPSFGRTTIPGAGEGIPVEDREA